MADGGSNERQSSHGAQRQWPEFEATDEQVSATRCGPLRPTSSNGASGALVCGSMRTSHRPGGGQGRPGFQVISSIVFAGCGTTAGDLRVVGLLFSGDAILGTWLATESARGAGLAVPALADPLHRAYG